MTPLSPSAIAQIKARLEKLKGRPYSCGYADAVFDVDDDVVAECATKDDSEFFAHAPEDLALLLAAYEDSHQRLADAVEAHSERDAIAALLSDRDEPGTYAKVAGLLAAYEEAQQQNGWQPIATAPKDKRVVLLYGEEHHRRVWARGYYFKGVPGDGEGWVASIFYTEPDDDTRGAFMNLTHWMPLPPAPPSRGEQAPE